MLDAILGKRGRLTADERRVMKTHTSNGAAILAGSAFTALSLAGCRKTLVAERLISGTKSGAEQPWRSPTPATGARTTPPHPAPTA
jgi:hypothetical protein